MGDPHDGDIEKIFEQIDRGTIAATARMAKAYRQSNLPQFKDWDGVNCFDCYEPLPELRVKDGRVRCVICQTKVEKLER
jgi:hypothetical protein